MSKNKGLALLWAGLILVAMLLGGSVSAQEGQFVAELIAITGQAEVKTANASYRPAQVRDKLRVGDTVRTLEQSRAKLLFIDESVTLLGEKTTLEITKFLFNRSTQERTGVLKTIEGRIRFLVQRISGAPQPAMTIESEVLSVGIRGTDGILETGPQHKVYLLESENPLSVQNKFTGQTMELLPMQFIIADKKRPFQINPITPEMLDSLIKQFRLSYEFTPKNLLSPGEATDMATMNGPGEGEGVTLPPVTQQPLSTMHFTGRGSPTPPQPPGPSPGP
ncbi:MAG: FecR family protein [Desulfobacca sp.]|uniref:FecR family protein n=1 Tax=Desulfobacca sp. TaxID=2067990 RepID=UPI00404ADC70